MITDDGGSLMGKVANFLSVTKEELLNVYHQYNHLSNVQNMNWEDMLVRVVRVFDARKNTEEKVRELCKINRNSRRVNSDLFPLFSALRGAGYKVGILSNNTTDLRERLTKEGIAPLVDDIVISAEVGFQKPHREIFDIAFQQLGVRPEEVIFVDDTPKSLEKAAEIGYAPVLFKSNEQLAENLRKLGVQF